MIGKLKGVIDSYGADSVILDEIRSLPGAAAGAIVQSAPKAAAVGGG